MKKYLFLTSFIVGGLIGFIINYTWSFQQNFITFSCAFVLYLTAGYFLSNKNQDINYFGNILLFWYILLLVGYSSYVNYSWDLPVLFLICIVAYILGYYLSKIQNKKNKIIAFGISFFTFSIILYFAVPWITYKNESNVIGSSDIIEYSLIDIRNPDAVVTDKDLKGKVVLFDFWFKRCGACMRQYPKMEKVYRHFKDNQNVVIYFVNNGVDEPEQITKTINERKFQIPVLLDKGRVLTNKLGLTGFPAFILIDKSGKIIESHLGYSRDEESVFEENTIKKIESILTMK